MQNIDCKVILTAEVANLIKINKYKNLNSFLASLEKREVFLTLSEGEGVGGKEGGG